MTRAHNLVMGYRLNTSLTHIEAAASGTSTAKAQSKWSDWDENSMWQGLLRGMKAGYHSLECTSCIMLFNCTV